MKLLITGALGHIGSRLIHDLKPGEFDEVVLLDNLTGGGQTSLFHLPEGVPFRFVEEDVCHADLERLFQGIDVVIHMAAITNAVDSFQIPKEVEQVNFKATQRVAFACAKTKSKLVFLSTTRVYGTQKTLVDENCTLEELKPQSPYAEAKLRAECCLKEFGEKEGLNFVICRFGTIFGTSVSMRFHTAINKFAWQACMGLSLTVWRTALHQYRPYLDLEDAVRALKFIIKRDLFDRSVYNVLTTNASVNEIVSMMRKFIPDFSVKLVDSPIMNQLSYEVSCERFKAQGFKFTGSLEEAIGETIQWLQNANAAAAQIIRKNQEITQ